MGDKVESNNQNGGITAHSVSLGDQNNFTIKTADAEKNNRRSAWKRPAAIISAFVVFLSGLVAILDYFNVKPFKEEKMNQEEKSIFNVFSQNQSGGITAGQVFLGKQQRSLNDSLKAQLRSVLDQRPTDSINVTAVMGDGEAFLFATEVLNYLRSLGRNAEGVDQAMFSAPVLGNNVELGEGVVKIIIGNQK